MYITNYLSLTTQVQCFINNSTKYLKAQTTQKKLLIVFGIYISQEVYKVVYISKTNKKKKDAPTLHLFNTLPKYCSITSHH